MLSLTLSLALMAPAPQGGQVVINEFSYDDSSTDNKEYVELHNTTNRDIDISGWKLDATDTATPDNNLDFTIPPNTTLKAGAYYVIGSPLVPNVDQPITVPRSTNLWENSNESLTLMDPNGRIIDTVVYEANKGWPAAKANRKEAEGVWGNYTGIEVSGVYTAILLGKNEVPPVTTNATGRAVIKFDSTTRAISIRVDVRDMTATAAHLHQAAKGSNGPVIVPLSKVGNDATTWTGSGTLTTAQATAFLAGDTYINVHSAANPGGQVRGQALSVPTTSISRHAGDSNNNGDDFHLLPSTPGMRNDLFQTLPYSDTFDSKTDEADLDEFGASFAFGHVIDPTKVSASNPNAITASPQGGKAAAFWDSSGGGNHNMLLAPATGDLVFEGYVYFDVKTVPAGQHETWSIGFGSTGTFYNTPDPGGSLNFTANGNVGVSWTYQILPAGATLYLVDHNDGGWGTNAATPPKVIGKIAVTTAGWRRLRLEVNNGYVTASYGGTLGCADGDNFSEKLLGRQPTCFYIGYREFLADNSTARPVTIDGVTVRASTSTTQTFGTPKATTRGTPMISSHPPTIGNSKFQIRLTGLVPSSGGLLLLGSRQNTPFDLGLIGGQQGSFVYVAPALTLTINSSAGGFADVGAPIPCNPSFLGQSVFWQGFDLDPALPTAIKLGNTAGFETKFGN